MSNLSPLPYNPIFEKFVRQDQAEADRLTGMVAYGIYKIAKREWVTEFKGQAGVAPTDAELRAYIMTWTPTRIEGVVKEADAVLLAFTQQVIEENRGSIREEALRGTTGKAIFEGVLAALVYTGILLGFGFVLRLMGIDLLSALIATKG